MQIFENSLQMWYYIEEELPERSGGLQDSQFLPAKWLKLNLIHLHSAPHKGYFCEETSDGSCDSKKCVAIIGNLYKTLRKSREVRNDFISGAVGYLKLGHPSGLDENVCEVFV